jgi:carbamoyl-phosphate synthase large subunit
MSKQTPGDKLDPLKATVAVTALNATDNPGPGVAVLRSLRHQAGFGGRLIGLAYDTLDPGVYCRDVVDDVFLIPYPSQGVEALESRLAYINDRVGGIDCLIPTLDSELPSFISLEGELADMGIHTFLPTRKQYDLRSKVHLHELGEASRFSVPATRIISEAEALYDIHKTIPYPFYVKGIFYGARLARSIDEAIQAFHAVAAQWGLPIIIQKHIDGDEFDVVAVGDGAGGLVGAVPMRKTTITDKGKGWAGIAIKDPALEALSQAFMAATSWRGPCELEILKEHTTGTYHLIEVNPRFPAWSYLSAGAGLNLPFAVLRLALGQKVEPETDYRVGTMFVRISLDQIASLEDLERITQLGEIVTWRQADEESR